MPGFRLAHYDVGRWVARILVFLCTCLAFTVRAEGDQANVDSVKVGFVYNFMKYTAWPAPTPGARLRVCVLGGGALLAQFQRLEGRAVGERTVEVMTQPPSEGLDTCQVVFLTSRQADNADVILGRLLGLPVLTVSDRPGFIQRGGMIELVEIDRHLRFEVNLAASQQAGLKLSGQMLKVAGRVWK